MNPRVPRLQTWTFPGGGLHRGPKGRSQTSSSGRGVIHSLVLLATAINPLSAAELRCPPRIPGPHPGFAQVGPVPTAHWLLHRMRLFDVPSGEAAKELPPGAIVKQRDGFTLSWNLTGSDSPLMICYYNGSGTYYLARVGPTPSRCTMRDDNGLRQAWCEFP